MRRERGEMAVENNLVSAKSERLAKRLTFHLTLDHGDFHRRTLLRGEGKAARPKLGGNQRDVLREEGGEKGVSTG